MIVQELQLENYCQHRHRILTFSPGLNLLVGPNGSGKSNILRALQFALTGDAGGDRNKLDDVSQGIADGAQSFVRSQLVHDGTPITIRRSLKPNANRMEVGGRRTLTTATEINNELWTRLGTTKKQIIDYVFVGQRKIDEMFDQKPADRAASLAALFGLSHASAVWKQAGEFINSIEIPTTLVNRDALQRKQEEVAQALDQVNATIAQLRIPSDLLAYRAERQAIINGYANWQRICRERAAREAELGDVETQKEQLAQQIDELLMDLHLLQDLVQEGQAGAAAAQKDLQQWQVYKASKRAHENYLAEAKAFEATPRPVKPAVPSSLALSERELDRYSELRGLLLKYSEDITTLELAPKTCPTCGTALTDVAQQAARVTELKQLRIAAEEEIAPLLARYADWEAYNHANTIYRADKLTWETEEARLKSAQAALAQLQPPGIPEANLRNVVEEHEENAAAVAALKEQYNTMLNTAARLDGRFQQLDAACVASMQAQNAATAYTREEEQRARLELQSLDNLLETSHEHTITRERLLAEQRYVDQQLRDFEAVMDRGARVHDALMHLHMVRQVFHHDEAPRVVSYTYIENMLEEVNNTLEIFDAPYRVVMDENLGFVAHFTDGIRIQPDRRLSVGERIVLALAFRITVNSTFASQVGLLIMDEPTAGLDEHNLGCLPRAIERLKELSAERGLQVFFVTHEPRIADIFDKVIDLGAAC